MVHPCWNGDNILVEWPVQVLANSTLGLPKSSANDLEFLNEILSSLCHNRYNETLPIDSHWQLTPKVNTMSIMGGLSRRWRLTRGLFSLFPLSSNSFSLQNLTVKGGKVPQMQISQKCGFFSGGRTTLHMRLSHNDGNDRGGKIE